MNGQACGGGRIEAFYASIGCRILWSAGCCVPRVTSQPTSLQKNRWLRSMFGGHRPDGEEWGLRICVEQKDIAHRLRVKCSLVAIGHSALPGYILVGLGTWDEGRGLRHNTRLWR